MLAAVTATCRDCGDERIFLPVEDGAPGGEFCCTSSDAAVFLLLCGPSTRGPRRRPRTQIA